LLGIPREDFLNHHIWELGFFKDIAANEAKFAELQTKNYVRYEDLPLETSDGRRIEVEFVSNVYLVDDERVIQCNIRDITDRKRTERMASDALTTLNRPNNTMNIIRDLLKIIKERTGVEAVGIRLKEGEDFPYYQTNGFPDSFVEVESHLCVRDTAGQVLKDSQGQPVLEGMCGNVLRGRTDAAQPFFTKAGSFWSNCTTDLLASTTDAERQAHTRNRCNSEGYESVAMIALRAGEEIIGLLQLNDHRRDQFTLELIAALEWLGASVGVALTRMRAEDKVHESKLMIEGVINAIPARVFWKDRRLVFLGCNTAFARDAGFADPRDVIGKDDFQMSWRDQAEKYRTDDLQIIESGIAKLLIDEIHTTPAGATISLLVSKLPFRNSKGEVIGVLGIYQDITERKAAEEAMREQLEELELWHDVTLGREGRVIELKREVNALLAGAGQSPRYPDADLDRESP
jgi:PAS domain S-box-containing protein